MNPTGTLPIGVFIPQPEIGNDPAEIRRFAATLEDMGFQHVLAYDHVVHGARPRAAEPAEATTDGNHEPFALLGYLAGVTQQLRLMTAVIILPQRQTVLVAKQAATVDLLSGGRLTVGVGIGWNELEFVALSEDFRNRARRFEEQIDLLRALWTSEAVDYTGQWHRVEQAGIRPLPLQRPIPLWIGGSAEPAVRRAARIADGFFVDRPAGPEAAAQLALLRDELDLRGRDPATFGLDGIITLGDDSPDRWRHEFDWWRQQGVSQITFSTQAGVGAIDEHLRQLEAALAAMRGM